MKLKNNAVVLKCGCVGAIVARRWDKTVLIRVDKDQTLRWVKEKNIKKEFSRI